MYIFLLLSLSFSLSLVCVFRAAFQYGVKMNDGRKTRRQTGANKEKAKLDREWQQISQVNGQLFQLLAIKTNPLFLSSATIFQFRFFTKENQKN